MSAHILEKSLVKGVSDLSLTINDRQVEALLRYLELLGKWNKTYNLTAVRDVSRMLPLHILDSLSIADFLLGKSFVDVGTGPGLPGIPLAILFPDKQFTLLDSNGKRIRFLYQVKQTLQLENISEVQSRVEAFHPERVFDGVISRAFTSLGDMLEQTEHLLAKDGHFYAMKGKLPEEELSQLAKKYIVHAIHKLSVPAIDAERHLVDLVTS